MLKQKFLKIILILAFLGVFLASSCKQQTPDGITLGAVLTLTGEAASYGTMMKNGMDIAVDEINNNGGIGGKKVQMLYEDSQFITKNAVSAAQKLIDVDHVQVITGITGSKNALAVAPVANAGKAVIIDPLSSSAKLTTEGGNYYFRIMPSDNFSGDFAAEWAIRSDWKNAAILYANDDWGNGIKDSTQKQFQSLGGSISAVESVEQGTKDFRTIITKLKAANPEVVFLFAYAPEAAIIIKQAKELKFEPHFIGSDNLSAGEFAQIGSATVEGVMFVLPAEGGGEVYENLKKMYKAKYNEDPSLNSIKSYDVVRLAAYAIRNVGNNGEKVREFLSSQLKDYTGASGKLEFDANGDIKNPSYEKMVYRNGAYTKLASSAQAQAAGGGK